MRLSASAAKERVATRCTYRGLLEHRQRLSGTALVSKGQQNDFLEAILSNVRPYIGALVTTRFSGKSEDVEMIMSSAQWRAEGVQS